ncbi:MULTISPECIES: response regulator transcription factor [unclassified Streptomyces]|uniref:response regulator transcription factor n=1 Tax=unclassified Streptomyces TaxID=2593676 RepID=UPI002E80C6B1|nr:response regulator transcription factor [Streptomyces sp. NBC_00589]WTI35050.1 response regulator transcription factor [Streptomyces sp. NBC_00775]WUB31276.1 response regulator transcription factor [Streptomyces sp. NBC_00589]
MRILVVEDEPKMRGLLRRALSEEGYAVDAAPDGPQALALTGVAAFDAMVLDVMLPGQDGFEVCAALRRQGNWLPVLMLTARDAVADRVQGLDGGADDYLTKPFSLEELLARLRALIRRGPVERPAVLTAGDLSLDPATRTIRRGTEELTLTAKEYALLEALLRRPGTVLTRAMLVEHCWDLGTSPGSNVVDAHIKALRGKIDRPYGTHAVETVRGAGYRLRRDGGRTATSTDAHTNTRTP